MARFTKYHAKKVEKDGMVFDSTKEYKRYLQLLELEESGKISDLKRQVCFELIPTQREPSPGVYTKGEKKGRPKPGKITERGVDYIADFVYTEDGQMIVEDSKGMRTKEYIIKRKLMLYIYGIRIRES